MCWLPLLFLGMGLSVLAQTPAALYQITVRDNQITIRAGILQRTLSINGATLRTDKLSLNGISLLDHQSSELSLSVHLAEPNVKPIGIRDTAKTEITQLATEKTWSDALQIDGKSDFVRQAVRWVHPEQLRAESWNNQFDHLGYSISQPQTGVTRLTLRARTLQATRQAGLTITQYYEIYEGHPAIRKWVEISNSGSHWLKIDDLLLDNSQIRQEYRSLVDLTPSEFGASTSTRSFGNTQQTAGVIVGSEVPSALRRLDSTGRTGYASAYFEWVIGPQETFLSEPVFLYGYAGPVVKTPSGLSTPLDRTVERSFQDFLRRIIGVLPATSLTHTPLWCSWSNFGALIADTSMRRMATLASRIGFKGMLLDAGWGLSEDPSNGATPTTRPDPAKFPDFLATCNAIRAEKLTLGFWVTSYRNPKISRDFEVIPDGYSLPRVRRGDGLAMSFASPWRTFYASDLLDLRDRYGVTYFKQDLTNIQFGDIAYNHDSRTHKESLLRGLRGLFDALDQVRQASPEVVQELTHEIYWGTPGTPCDLAALKHSLAYHIPPNDYSGSGPRKKRYTPAWPDNPDSLRAKLLEGCFNARTRVYAYRGLPLYGIEYYAAATVNHRGSLSAEVQRRQVCSWLMGVPSVYAGDLASLTEENIRVYRQCFDLIDELQRKYFIYSHFQFSGVPAPTDTDWHWWGKLNEAGEGAVVVLRGRGGQPQRVVNIPWVLPDKRYAVRLRFSGRELGTFSGQNLINGQLSLKLQPYSQEIIELTKQ